MTRRQIRALLYVAFALSLATTLITLFVGGPTWLGVPAGIVAVILGGVIDSGYPWRKK